MACRCRQNKTKGITGNAETPVQVVSPEQLCDPNLPQCFMCALKHLSTAWILFEEYKNGYPSYIKHLVQSIHVSEQRVRTAFQLYMKAQAHMNMAACELVGNTADELSNELIQVANEIRDARLKLEASPLYIPPFARLLERIQKLRFSIPPNLPDTSDTSDKTKQ